MVIRNTPFHLNCTCYKVVEIAAVSGNGDIGFFGLSSLLKTGCFKNFKNAIYTQTHTKLFSINKCFAAYFLGRNKKGLKVHADGSQPILQPGTPGRKYLVLHPSCRGQLNSTHPKQDLNLFFDSGRKHLDWLCFLTISWKKKKKKRKVSGIKICRETSFKDPERWKADVVGQKVSENITQWDERDLEKKYV